LFGRSTTSLEDDDAVYEKLNPAQADIAGTNSGLSTSVPYTYTAFYERLEVVNRGVNFIVDSTAGIPFKVGERLPNTTPVVPRMQPKRLTALLNWEPNPFQDAMTFKTSLIMDFILDGNVFIYWDGVHLYHLPATKIQIDPDSKTYIKGYRYGETYFKPSEIINIKENGYASLYRGKSRLAPAINTLSKLSKMNAFQDSFFNNGAVTGVILKTQNPLSEKHKERLTQSWQTRYSPTGGGRTPIILDGGMELDKLSNATFKEMDFESSITENEKKVLKALGIPPVLLDSGNNANIKPNLRMFYLETVLPIIERFNAAYARFFGFEIWADTTNVAGLQPELTEQASYFATLVNSGLFTPNEARFELGKDPITGHDDLRIPANIAGSASNPSQGGRPPKDED